MAEDMGFEVFAAPSMRFVSGDASEFDRFAAIVNGKERPVAVFPSPTAASEFCNHFGCASKVLLDKCLVASIGSATSQTLRELGVEPHIEPAVFDSEGLAKAIADRAPEADVLIVRSSEGSGTMREMLERRGSVVSEITAYRPEPCGLTPELKTLFDSNPDVAAFTSPMSVRLFIESLEEYKGGFREFFNGKMVASIGIPTADALGSRGITVNVVPEISTFRDLLTAVRARFV
jgi:uroporphyrinogen-III synthase